ncbi:hypothetical protein J4E83_006941 [Alternaria metachromatica]|uniref:uncharacterized protein n=1 Tax=Alternaria metachromatica TaxID=283354 RepID=UPI0020C541F0|nr:uncharacterized protein J4E83_006941 [Alternaria metachromatica]KAI4615215.1 hypothetical protein J4E83_006941 [Alternaria metachromatica]
MCTYKRLDGVSAGATASGGSSQDGTETSTDRQRVGISIDFLLNFTNPSGYRPSAAIAAEAAELDDADGEAHVQPHDADQDMTHDQSFFEFADLPSVFFSFPFVVSGREVDYASPIISDGLTPELEDAYAFEVRVREMLQQLSAKHSSMLERGDAVDATFDYQLAEAVFTVGNVRHFVWAFFRYFHYSFPILHKPTFDIQTVSFPLLLALVLFGSLPTLESDTSIGVRRFSHVAEAYVFDQLPLRQMSQADNSAWVEDEHLQLLQAGLLFLVFLNNSNDMVTRRRIRLQRIPSLVAAVRASGLFAHKQRHIISSQTEHDWQGFINDEMRSRLGMWTCLFDSTLSVFFNNTPQVAICEAIGDLPCEETLLSIVMTSRMNFLAGMNIEPMLRATDRWKALWDVVSRDSKGNCLPELGFEKHAAEYWWLTKTILRVSKLGGRSCRYMQPAPCDSTQDLHDFVRRYKDFVV